MDIQEFGVMIVVKIGSKIYYKVKNRRKMYSDNKTIQILISLLKEFGVKHAVLSPGTRNIPLVHSLEKDSFFNCYSIVDERSAGYFAIGLAIEAKEPVIISCTSATATTNYSSAICEAYEQKLPLIVLTGDRNPYYLDQLEDQMVPQTKLYPGRTKKQITLPIIKDDLDYWYCRRIINEALLEMNHRGGGPIHINIPTEWGIFAQNFNTKELPAINPIKRVTIKDMFAGKIPEVEELKSQKRILVIYGQSRPISQEILNYINGFSSKYRCVISAETVSNIQCKSAVNTSLITRALSKDMFTKEFAPDLVISVNGNYVSQIKGLLNGCSKEFEHWTINEEGVIVDQFKKLTRVFECSTGEFFRYFDTHGGGVIVENEYFDFWNNKIASLRKPNFSYSSNYAMQEFLKQVPPNSLIHYGNGVSVHIGQYFPVDDTLEHYCHTGTTTIDGSVSSFIGQTAISSKLSFLFVGDLSFFYDMNGIWNRYVGSNVRILLYNNEGGETFHWNAAKDIDTLPQHISAEHFATAKGWVESRGFKYLSAKNQEEFDALLSEFVTSDSDRPILFEVFTKKELDAKILMDYYEECRKDLN